MSCIGVDFGNDSCLIGLVQGGGVDIILNESSNRKNPCMVSFNGTSRSMGEAAQSVARSNYKNTVREVKRLIGRKWADPELQKDLSRMPFTCEENPETGGVVAVVNYNDETTRFTPEQVVAMMLTKVVEVAKGANGGVAVADVVVSIPAWYTDSMRCAMLSACQIADLNCLRLVHEGTATALAYGIYKSAKQLFDKEVPQHTLFMDLGHCGFTATLVDYVQESLVVKATAFDRNLGGRDFDYAVACWMAKDFAAKNPTMGDPMGKPKSMLKLLDAAEKAKKNLSPIGVTDTVVNVECLVEDTDYNSRLSLEQFEEILGPLVDRIEAPISRVLAEAGLAPTDLAAVEIVGGSTRVPMVKRKMAGILGTDVNALNMGLSTTLNADESVARGAALQCAILSSRFRVKDFSITDAVPYPIRLSWDEGDAKDAMDTDAAAEKPEAAEDKPDAAAAESDATTAVLFAKNAPTPKTRRINFKRNKPFEVVASYDEECAEDLPPGASRELAKFKILEIPSLEPVSIRLNVKHDINGVLSVQSAQMMEAIMEEEEVVPDLVPGTPATATTTPPTPEGDGAAAPEGGAETGEGDKKEGGEESATAGAEGKEGEAEGEAKSADAPAPEGGAPEGDAMDVEPPSFAAESAKEEEKPKPVMKKKFRKVNLMVDTSNGRLSKQEVDAFHEAEAKMAQQDRILKETADKRNELESYIYSFRDRLVGDLKIFASESEAASLTTALEAAEEWLYSDEGFDSSKSVYSSKLKELQTPGNRIEDRKTEQSQRQTGASVLRETAETYKTFANSQDEAYSHISDEETDKVRTEADAALAWLYDNQNKQSTMKDCEDPCFTIKDIKQKKNALDALCKPIMNKPKPKPKPATPTPPPAGEEKAGEGKEGEGKEGGEGGEGKEEQGAKEGKEGEVPPAAADGGAPAADETVPSAEEGKEGEEKGAAAVGDTTAAAADEMETESAPSDQ